MRVGFKFLPGTYLRPNTPLCPGGLARAAAARESDFAPCPGRVSHRLARVSREYVLVYRVDEEAVRATDRRSVAILAVGLALATILAAGSILVYARGSRAGGEPITGSAPTAWALPTSRLCTHDPRVAQKLKVKAGSILGPRLVVSEEYVERVLGIAQSDVNVSRLLEEGYNVTKVKPIVRAYVGADGSVSLRADEALVVLRKDRSVAVVLVSLSEERVTRLVVHAVTVVEK